jgi:hypothetical protein
MCHVTGANFDFWLECLVMTNRTSRIMLKVVEKPKTEPIFVFVLSKVKFVIVCFVLSSLSSADVLWCINVLELLLRLLRSCKNLLSI